LALRPHVFPGVLVCSLVGVAMGLLLDDSVPEPIILTDILGLEDAFGTMDFKVCAATLTNLNQFWFFVFQRILIISLTLTGTMDLKMCGDSN
jgi:hypothetical protein